LGSLRTSPELIPEEGFAPRFWHHLIRFRHFIGGSFALASLNLACRDHVPTLPQRSPARRVGGPLNLNAFRHADPKTLARLEDYFWYTFQCLDYLAKALAVKTEVMRGPAPPRPQRKPALPKHDILFPLKSFH
jgi:hypothetical protein